MRDIRHRFQLQGQGFSWGSHDFDLEKIESLIENSRWADILRGKSENGWKCVRFRTYCPRDLDLEVWARLLGASGTVLTHQMRTSRLYRFLLDHRRFNDQPGIKLLLFAQPFHDLGEAHSSSGDIMTGRKTKEQRREELTSLLTVLCDIFSAYPGLGATVHQHVQKVLDGSMAYISLVNRVLTMYDHFETAIAMYQESLRIPESSIAAHLQFLSYDVIGNALPTVIRHLDLIPSLHDALSSEAESIFPAFACLPNNPAIETLYNNLSGVPGMNFAAATANLQTAEELWHQQIALTNAKLAPPELIKSILPDQAAQA